MALERLIDIGNPELVEGCFEDETWRIREVWADNIEEEFQKIESVVENYKYIALDTEFPGIVVRPESTHKEYSYQTVKMNVDLLKVIQIGITFADEFGHLPPGVSTWQFNFQFDLDSDLHAEDSIRFLQDCGVDFEQQQRKGIKLEVFGEQIMNSGLVMREEVKWISFHGTYDFGYLLKLLTCQKLPNSEIDFFDMLNLYFPALYDIKYLIQAAKFKCVGGNSLQKIAEHLEVERVGQCHQAGSDSLVTCHTFFRLMQNYFDNQIDDAKYSGIIYGLGVADGQLRFEQLTFNPNVPPRHKYNNQSQHQQHQQRQQHQQQRPHSPYDDMLVPSFASGNTGTKYKDEHGRLRRTPSFEWNGNSSSTSSIPRTMYSSSLETKASRRQSFNLENPMPAANYAYMPSTYMSLTSDGYENTNSYNFFPHMRASRGISDYIAAAGAYK
eukprot:Platyproteum_vivax@DN3932_c0_g1_i1.p1